jgi:hypothetical protein
MANLSRLRLLRVSAAGADAGLFGRGALADPNGFPIRIQLNSVGNDLQKDFDGARRKIAEIGYREAKKTKVDCYYVEQEPPFERPPLESAHISYDYLHELTT